jgi:hypothetical protein
MANKAFDAAIDRLKYVAATADQVQGELGSQDPRHDPQSAIVTIEAALCRLTHTQHMLGHVVAAFCPHCAEDMEHYTDGRRVTAHLRFGDGTQYVYVWYPEPTHPMNQPRELGTVMTRNKTRKHVFVSAPGHLDAVSEFPGCDRPPRVLGGDEW